MTEKLARGSTDVPLTTAADSADQKLPLVKSVDPRNPLNDLNATEWVPETVSVWNQKGLGANHPDAAIERQHPAPFSFTDVSRLVRFFTKRGAVVLDPFVGVGSTLKACAVEGRKGIGIELNANYCELARQRLRTEVRDMWATLEDQEVRIGDARDLVKDIPENSIDFVVTSPPYWNILHKEDHKAKQERIAKKLDTRYGDDTRDLGNIHDYEEFLNELSQILGACGRPLKPKKYMAVIVSDFREKSKFVMFHADILRALSRFELELRGLTVLYQRHKRIFPYGYPYAYVPNIHNQFIVILQNAKKPENAASDRMLNTVVIGDCLDNMRQLADQCADLIIADPPYNLDKDFGTWKEAERKAQWLPWCKQWLDECNRVMKPAASIFVYGIHHHLCWLQCYMYEIGLTYRRQIIWHYENGFAGYTKSLAAHYEPLLWFSKGNGYTYHPIREPYKSTERLKHKITKNGKEWTPHPEGRLAGDVWKFPVLAGRRFSDEKVNHPTQKPLSISTRIVNHFSNPGELIIIPFAGSGSECVAARLGRRHFIGFELNSAYAEIARARLRSCDDSAQQLDLLTSQYPLAAAGAHLG